MKVLGIDIGGTNFSIGEFDEDKLVGEIKSVTIRGLNKDEVLEKLSEEINKYQFIELVGIASPGIIRDDSYINGLAGISGWVNFNLAKELNEKGVKQRVVITNDANAATMAEWKMGAGKGSTSLAVFTIGTGIGGGLVLNNELVVGANGFGGEFGCIFVGGDANSSNGKLNGSPQASAVNTEIMFEKKYGKRLDAKTIFDNRDSDPRCKEFTEWFYYGLATLLFNVQYVTDPEKIILVGGITQRPELLENVKTKLDELHAKYGADTIKAELLIGDFKQSAGVYGAGAFAISKT